MYDVRQKNVGLTNEEANVYALEVLNKLQNKKEVKIVKPEQKTKAGSENKKSLFKKALEWIWPEGQTIKTVKENAEKDGGPCPPPMGTI